MANKEPENKSESKPFDLQDLATAISSGIAQAGNLSGPIKQINITQYRTKSKENPQGLQDHERVQFSRTYWQNGVRIELWQVSDEDVARLNQLKAGRYIDRKVEVVERPSETGEPTSVEIRYSNATLEQRFDLKNRFRNFTELLMLILDEQAVAA
jgi:hypothetical protein